MTANSSEEFKNYVLQQMHFDKFETSEYTLYKNKQNKDYGYLLSYARQPYYDLGIADYTIPNDFSLSFDNQELLIRFGLVYKGTTEFCLNNNLLSSFSPSSFFVIEKGLKGKQFWKAGQHYHGVEVTIHERYFTELIYPNFPALLDFNTLRKNYTYTYLPLEITDILRKLQGLAYENTLNSIYLEAKILECIAILINELRKQPDNAFTNQINYGNIRIGENRIVKLTSADIRSIQKAHDIIAENYNSPPSIKALSKIVYLNEQKLKAGFSKHYHMSIGTYTNHVRMTVASNLLSTTDLSIETIAKRVGYHYSSNFSKMFKKIYGKNPLDFRKTK